jgi:hypothetical protein
VSRPLPFIDPSFLEKLPKKFWLESLAPIPWLHWFGVNVKHKSPETPSTVYDLSWSFLWVKGRKFVPPTRFGSCSSKIEEKKGADVLIIWLLDPTTGTNATDSVQATCAIEFSLPFLPIRDLLMIRPISVINRSTDYRTGESLNLLLSRMRIFHPEINNWISATSNS